MVASNSELLKNVKTFNIRFGFVGYDMMGKYWPIVSRQATNLQEVCIFGFRIYVPDDQADGHENVWSDLLGGEHCGSHGRVINIFANLRILHIWSSKQPVSELDAAMRLPALSCLLLGSVYQILPIKDWTIFKSSSNIKSLDIQYCYMESEVVAQLLCYIETLKTFRYTHGSSDEYAKSMGKPKFSWSAFSDDLGLHQSSLSEICLHGVTDQEIYANFTGESGYGMLGSLRGFSELRSVDVALHILTNLAHDNTDLTELLPSNLGIFATCLDYDELDPRYCANALESLKEVLTRGADRELNLTLEKYSPYGQLRLSGALQALMDAGINKRVSRYDEFECISLDTLRLMKVDGYEDSLSGDEMEVSEEDFNDDDEEEWDYDEE